MKKQLLLLFFFQALLSCSVFSQQAYQPFGDVDNNYILKKYDSIYTVLSGTVFSKDSIIIKTTFINHSGKDFYLYKPLIPFERLIKKATFGINLEDESSVNQPIIRFRTYVCQNYRTDTGQYFPQILPPVNMDKANFLLLPSSDSVSFTINLAKFYDLESVINSNKQYRNFSIVYGVITPLVIDKFEQVYQFENNKNELKPVFVIVGMPNAEKNEKYLSKRLYFTVADN